MKLESKLKRLGFRKVDGYWYVNDYYYLAIGINNNKVDFVQMSKHWFTQLNDFNNYNEYLKEVKKMLKKLSKIL